MSESLKLNKLISKNRLIYCYKYTNTYSYLIVSNAKKKIIYLQRLINIEID